MNKLHRVVLGGGDMLQRSRVDYRINAFEGSFQAGSVADIPNEITQCWILLIAKFLSHFVLLELISAKNDEPVNFWKSM
jgi:hypothetical protein